jgi:serine/threonine protein kinase
MNDLIGQQIDHYRLDSLVGEGGMGAVYRAYDLNLAIPVALKVMHSHLARQPEFQDRFLQEAQAEARLDHPSIVDVKYFGAKQGLLYMVMAYMAGGSLGTYIRQLQETGAVTPLHEAVTLLAQVADALGYAHRNGVVHCDVKPGNVLVQRLEEPSREGDLPLRSIVTDFGLARVLEGGVATHPGALPQCMNGQVKEESK